MAGQSLSICRNGNLILRTFSARLNAASFCFALLVPIFRRIASYGSKFLACNITRIEFEFQLKVCSISKYLRIYLNFEVSKKRGKGRERGLESKAEMDEDDGDDFEEEEDGTEACFEYGRQLYKNKLDLENSKRTELRSAQGD